MLGGVLHVRCMHGRCRQSSVVVRRELATRLSLIFVEVVKLDVDENLRV